MASVCGSSQPFISFHSQYYTLVDIYQFTHTQSLAILVLEPPKSIHKRVNVAVLY